MTNSTCVPGAKAIAHGASNVPLSSIANGCPAAAGALSPDWAWLQLAISSVAASADARPRDERSGVDDYRPDLVELEPRHAPDTIDARRELLAAERPFIEHFEYADTWGHATVHLRGGKVEADVFRGFEQTPWKQPSLSDLL